jgi:hypothetical protein
MDDLQERDLFAMFAMINQDGYLGAGNSFRDASVRCYEWADCMMEARKQPISGLPDLSKKVRR